MIRKRPEEFHDQPFLDYWVGWWTQKPIAWLAKRALKRGDVHEFNHLFAAVRAGNSSHVHWPCCMPDHLLGTQETQDTITLTFGRPTKIQPTPRPLDIP